MVPQKNLPVLLHALAGLPGVRLRMIGDGPQRSQLERLAAQLQVSVEWIGQVPNDAVARWLQKAQLFVFPSTYEGDPKAILEAMACEVPVVASDIPEHRAVMAHRQTGWLVPGRVDAVRTAIQTLLADATLRQMLARRAKEMVVAQRTLPHQFEAERQALLEVVSRDRVKRMEASGHLATSPRSFP